MTPHKWQRMYLLMVTLDKQQLSNILRERGSPSREPWTRLVGEAHRTRVTVVLRIRGKLENSTWNG